MQAMTIDRFGGADELTERDLPEPPVGPDYVLIRTKAVGLNPVDWKVREGYLSKIFPHHFPLVPCWDVAGVVERVGPSVTEFQAGDEVIAYNRRDDVQFGTLAEFTVAPVRCIARKPAIASWAEAAGLPLAGLTAYQTVFGALDVQEGETLLVHAASGGVGSFAVQLGLQRKARVIGSAGEANQEFLRSVGVEPVVYGDGLVDAVRQLSPRGVDKALDLVDNTAQDQSIELLSQPRNLASVVDSHHVKNVGGQYVFVRPNSVQLQELSGMMDRGDLTVHVAKTFAFSDAAAAFTALEQGGNRGKVVVEFD